jgi:hypothetical protein
MGHRFMQRFATVPVLFSAAADYLFGSREEM